MSPPDEAWSLRGRENTRSQRAESVQAAAARLEWLDLAEKIESLGGRVVVLPSVPELSGLPFAAEAGHPIPPAEAGGKPRFLLPRMKPAHRHGEAAVWGPFMASLGFELVELADGIWEGQGDVAAFDGATIMFHGGRTDRVGLRAAKAHFPGEVLEIFLDGPALHGNLAVLPLPEVSGILVCADVVDDDSLAMLEARFGRDRVHFVSEEEIHCFATNGVVLGDTVIVASILPKRTKGTLTRLGMKVVEIAMPELCEKAGGGPRCLVCVAEGLSDAIQIPDAARLAPHAQAIRAS